MTLDRRNLPAIREGELGHIRHDPAPGHFRSPPPHRRRPDRPSDGGEKRIADRRLVRRVSPGLRGPGAAPRGPGPVRHGLGRPRHGQGPQGRPGGPERPARGPIARLRLPALGLPRDSRFFPVSRGRVHQIIQEAADSAGIPIPEHVGAVHVLRHSGAIARLEATGNPKALQDQLRHSSARMTLRYMKTLSAKRSLEINQGVDLSL